MNFHPMGAAPVLLSMAVGAMTASLVVLLMGRSKTFRWWVGNALVGALLAWVSVETGLRLLPKHTTSRTYNLDGGVMVSQSTLGVDRRLLLAAMVLVPLAAAGIAEAVNRARNR
jgi:hypothetical protein